MLKNVIYLLIVLLFLSSCGSDESPSLSPQSVSSVGNAGADLIIDEQTEVTFNVADLDSDTTIASYEWVQISGTNINFNTATPGLVSFITPTVTASEELVFALTVTDNEGATSTDQISVFVNPVNEPPVAIDVDLSLPVSQSEFLSALSGSDPDGDSLLFTIQSQPTLGTIEVINSATGAFRYNPSGETGTDQFSFTVSDSEFSSNVAVGNITIEPVDLVEAGPNDVISNAELIYQNSTITGSLSNTDDVDWFRFDAFETGSVAIYLEVPTNSSNEFFEIIITDSAGSHLVSTRTGRDVMVYANVIAGESYYVQLISATNFVSESYILEIENYNSGQAVLSWTAPTKNTDDSDLVDLAGYKIYYGLSGSILDKIVEVLDPNLVTYTIDHFKIDGSSYDFAMTAKNSSNIESSLSRIVSRSF